MVKAAPTPLRDHHYRFAHRLLPRIFFAHTDILFQRLQNDPDAEIRRLWTMAAEPLPDEKHLVADGLVVEYSRSVDGTSMVVVTMPPALAQPEAIFVAMVIRGQERRYITYERSEHLLEQDKSVAVLCEWFSDGSRANYGERENYDRATFDKALGAFLKTKPASNAITTPDA
jgi:hypothetical protein